MQTVVLIETGNFQTDNYHTPAEIEKEPKTLDDTRFTPIFGLRTEIT